MDGNVMKMQLESILLDFTHSIYVLMLFYRQDNQHFTDKPGGDKGRRGGGEGYDIDRERDVG